MNPQRQRRYLTHILDAIQRIEDRTAAGQQAFTRDDVVQDAVIRRLETLADASGLLSQELRDRHPEIPWRQVADFRNRVAHGYLDVDLGLVWRVIAEDLPALRAVVEQELALLPE